MERLQKVDSDSPTDSSISALPERNVADSTVEHKDEKKETKEETSKTGMPLKILMQNLPSWESITIKIHNRKTILTTVKAAISTYKVYVISTNIDEGNFV